MKTCRKCSTEFDSRDCPSCNRARAAAYRAANPDKVAEQWTEWEMANADRLKEARSEWMRANNDRIKANKRACYAANPDRHKAVVAAWAKANPEKCKVLRHKRRARLAGCEGSHTEEEIKELYELQKGMCVVCRSSISRGYHADHIVSLVNGGSNDIYNIQLLCAPCNLSKNSKHPVDFMQQRGYLL